jgi:gamma-glutamylcyclotransferase (GGCT)/AIG2-like uncharacterized protein YtfP
MAVRCPRAAVVGAAILLNYALELNGKTSNWGVANIRHKRGKVVNGLLWTITPECEQSLDRYEGYPHLYEKRKVTVYAEDGTPYRAMAYVMTAAHSKPALPSKLYYQGIMEGFRQNRIPSAPLKAALEETYSKMMGGLGK